MALNRNHSQEGGVVVPNGERYRRGGRGPPHTCSSQQGRGPAGPGGGRELGPAGAAPWLGPGPVLCSPAVWGRVGAGGGERAWLEPTELPRLYC